MRLRKCLIVLSVIAFLFIAVMAGAEQEYDPPFQISGIVKIITGDIVEIYLPYINKQVSVKVLPATTITNRIDSDSSSANLSSIQIEDLVVVKGFLDQEAFCSTEISYLSVSEN